MEGYKWHFNETVLTVWSAPNYCYRCGNVAAILELDENLNKDFTIFEAAPQAIQKMSFLSNLFSFRKIEVHPLKSHNQTTSCNNFILFCCKMNCVS